MDTKLWVLRGLCVLAVAVSAGGCGEDNAANAQAGGPVLPRRTVHVGNVGDAFMHHLAEANMPADRQWDPAVQVVALELRTIGVFAEVGGLEAAQQGQPLRILLVPDRDMSNFSETAAVQAQLVGPAEPGADGCRCCVQFFWRARPGRGVRHLAGGKDGNGSAYTWTANYSVPYFPQPGTGPEGTIAGR